MGLGLATGAAALAAARARAQAKEVKIAMLVPLSGPWARQGILEQMGAAMAIDDVNNAGGIKSLGGAKLKLMEYDTGDSAEKAKDAAQRMVAQEPDLVGGFGCWLSTFTLAVDRGDRARRAAVADAVLFRCDHQPRLQVRLPVLAHRRCAGGGTVPIIMDLAEKATGKRPTKVAIIGDNTAAAVSFLQADPRPRAEERETDAVVDEVYTPPLTDATTLVQPVRARSPISCCALDQCAGRQAAGRQVRRVRHAGDQTADGRRRRPLVRARAAEDRRRRRTWKACWLVWRTGPARRWRTWRSASSSAPRSPGSAMTLSSPMCT